MPDVRLSTTLAFVLALISLAACTPTLSVGDGGLDAAPSDGAHPDGSPGDVRGDGPRSDVSTGDAPHGDGFVPTDTGPDVPMLPNSQGAMMWANTIQPLIASSCGPCHLGQRFAFASLVRAGTTFTPEETATNYQTFLDVISLDAPRQSRLLAKAQGDNGGEGIAHAGGARLAANDATYNLLLGWINLEKSERCPQCGTTAPRAWIAYVAQPRIFWALEADPFRADRGLRDRSHIMMQPVDPATMQPNGTAVDFLGDSFCGADGTCDFGNLAVSHAGDRMAFECRLSLTPVSDPLSVRWNMCIAEIGPDGRAVNPRFLMPPERRHNGYLVARSDPYGLTDGSGQPLKGVYDQHFQVRRRNDRTPVFTPDDRSVMFASQGPDPRTGAEDFQTYHGYEALDHIVQIDVDGTNLRTIYRNEGGNADNPFFLHNGNVAFHTWNLERMDRHMYTQATADGNMQIPVLLGNLQGPNMWGKATQLANGIVIGMTGRRRSAIALYVPFAGDHTLGTGLDPSSPSFSILDPTVFNEVADFPVGYCDPSTDPNSANCAIDHFYADPTYAPDGRALIAYTPNRTYVDFGDNMFTAFRPPGSTLAEQLAYLDQYTPRGLGIYLMDHRGNVTSVLPPPDGMIYRFPAWVGRTSPQRVQPRATDEAQHTADLHIADVPLWFSFRDMNGETDRSNVISQLDTIVAVRVLVKEAAGNACENDDRPYRFAVNNAAFDHPTHLGINNATGYRRLVVPQSVGGDAWGDVPVAADHSVNLRLPAGELLLVQGVNADGHVVRQHARVFTMPPGQRVNASVKRAQYHGQCSPCHGTITPGEQYVPLSMADQLSTVAMDFDTVAAARPPVDLTDPSVERRPNTFLHVVRPLLDRACVSCHSGDSPGGELSLESVYSTTGNYPAGRWATTPGYASTDYMNFVPSDRRVPAYNYSVTWAWDFQQDENEYKLSPQYSGLINDGATPLAALAPWDPAYQNLYANDGNRFVYLSGFYNANFGRSDRFGGLSSDSWLIEILSGRDISPGPALSDPTMASLHQSLLSERDVRDVMAVIDTGFAYMSRCDDRPITAGPNAGQPWGSPTVH